MERTLRGMFSAVKAKRLSGLHSVFEWCSVPGLFANAHGFCDFTHATSAQKQVSDTMRITPQNGKVCIFLRQKTGKKAVNTAHVDGFLAH